MSAWQIVGVVLGAIALLIAVILCIPGRLLICYDARNGFQVSGSVLFFRFGGRKNEKTERASKKTPKEPASDAAKKLSEKHSAPRFRTLADHAGELAELLGKTLRQLGKLAGSVVVRELSLTCVVGGDDPAETADQYGRVCAILYPSLAALHAALRVREEHEEITIGCAFGEEDRLSLRMLLQLRAVHAVAAALPLTKPVLRLLSGLRRG